MLYYLVLQFAVFCEGFYLLQRVFDCFVVAEIEGFSIAGRWVVRIDDPFDFERLASVFQLLRIVQLLRIGHIYCFVLLLFGHLPRMFQVNITQFKFFFDCQRQGLLISDQTVVNSLEIFLMNVKFFLIDFLFFAFLSLLLFSSFPLPVFHMLLGNIFTIFSHGLQLIFRFLLFVQLMVHFITHISMALSSPQLLSDFFVLLFDYILFQLDFVLSVIFGLFFLQHVVLLEVVQFMFIHRFVFFNYFVQLFLIVLFGFLQTFLELLFISLESRFELLPFLHIFQKLCILRLAFLRTNLKISKFLLDSFNFIFPHFLFPQLPLQFLLLLSTVIQFFFMLPQLFKLFMSFFFLLMEGLQLLFYLFFFSGVVAVVVVEEDLVCCILVLGNQLLDGQFGLVFRFMDAFYGIELDIVSLFW